MTPQGHGDIDSTETTGTEGPRTGGGSERVLTEQVGRELLSAEPSLFMLSSDALHIGEERWRGGILPEDSDAEEGEEAVKGHHDEEESDLLGEAVLLNGGSMEAESSEAALDKADLFAWGSGVEEDVDAWDALHENFE